MRKINKPNKVPNILSNPTCATERKNLISNRLIIYNRSIQTLPIKRSINDVFYRGHKSDPNSTYSVLFSLYEQKCAYCEEMRSNLDVEHYRPKNRVKGEIYPGYFWLGYEWQNLIVACKECNRDHKKNYFPVANRINPARVPLKNRSAQYYNLQELKDHESPSILNPEENNFEPLNYFQLDLTGKPNGKDTQGRGQETIDKCELDRGDVNMRRQGIIDKIRQLIKVNLVYLEVDESNYKTVLINIRNCIKEHIILNDSKIEHTLVYLLIAKDYKSLIIPPLDHEYHKIVLEAFQLEFP